MRILAILAFIALTACQDETAQNTDPVALTPDAVGFYCQMNLLEHPGPKAQVHLAGLPGAPLFFSQVRDAVAYARMPEQSHQILAIWVNDMKAPGATWDEPGNSWIAADSAWYVVGAAIMGGMGAPELVPFADEGAARAFAAEHGGNVMLLPDIPDSAVLAPAGPGVADDDPAFQDRLRALSRKVKG